MHATRRSSLRQPSVMAGFFRLRLEHQEVVGIHDLIRSYRPIRAIVVLLAAQGIGDNIIRLKLNAPRQVVSRWRKRFFDLRRRVFARQWAIVSAT